MKIPFYQVDSFSDRPFHGNPAAVCVLDDWLDDELLAAIAAENNLSETAFLVREDEGWRIRWYTPAVEVNLCGHATLAAAHVAFSELGVADVPLTFASRSGPLSITPLGSGRYRMDFPAVFSEACDPPLVVAQALGTTPDQVRVAGEDYLCVLPDAAAVRGLEPDMHRLGFVEARGVIVTAPGEDTDICSRFFGPHVGVPEDPVTGSAHCALAPYWSERLGRSRMTAAQLSARGGRLEVEHRGDRVWLEGPCLTIIRGQVELPA
ncbi:MAG: PhzF family phenazine biosynthesis protein [Pseudomonadota bacterium]